jgi:hypothetical protein
MLLRSSSIILYDHITLYHIPQDHNLKKLLEASKLILRMHITD